MSNVAIPISIATVCSVSGGLRAYAEQVSVPVSLATAAGSPVYVEVFVEDGARFAKMAQLEDSWDGEGAPAPSRETIKRANEVVHWALETGLVTDIEADVLGGVGVILRAYTKTVSGSAWVACMNNGLDTVVLSRGTEVCGHAPWDAAGVAKTKVVGFLTHDPNAASST